MTLSLVKAQRAPSADSCPTCGKPIDPLRAGRVALLGERFHYFCDEICSAQFLGADPHASRFSDETQEPPRVAERPPVSQPRPATAFQPPDPDDPVPSQFPVPAGEGAEPPYAARAERADQTPRASQHVPLPAESSRSLIARRAHEPVRVPRRERKVLPLLLTVLSLSASLVGASSARLGERGLRVGLSAILLAFALEMISAARTRRRLTLRALLSFAPLAGVVALATLTVLGPREGSAAGLLPTVGLIMFGYVALRALSARLTQRTAAEARILGEALAAPGSKTTSEQLTLTGPAYVPVDAVVLSGHGDVHPNAAREGYLPVGPGSLVFAGGKLARGELALRVLRTGDTRYVARLVGSGTLHAIHPARYRSIERLLVFGTLLASVTIGLFAWVSSEASWLPFLLAGTLASVVGMLHRVEVPRLMWARSVLAALERGVVFPSFEQFDRASFVDQVVLSGRGVVFAGAPTFVDLVWLGPDLDADLVASEVAGAEVASTHPLGQSLRAAITERGITPQKPRRVEELPGLGVVARSRQNHDLVIGNRELLLRHAISIASAEARTQELEAERHELLYIARDGRLVGYAVFEDGVREGCFAAVQDILGAGMEPVMLSGSSQAVCEAAGRALEIEHVRAEVLPEDRAAVVRSLIESGRVVGMVGTLPRDEDALLEADIGIAFGAESARAPEALARTLRDDLRAAAFAIVTARSTRERLGKMLLASLLPPLVAGLAAGFGLSSPALMPTAGLIGLGTALWLGRHTLFPEQNPLPKGRSAE